MNDEMIDNEAKIAKICNEYSVMIVKNLRILTEKEKKYFELFTELLTVGSTFTENNLSEVEMALKKNTITTLV